MTHECSCRHDSPMALDTPRTPARAEQTVAEVALRQAGALRVMKDLGINHCCGAHLTLREAAAAAGVPLDALLAALNEPRKTRMMPSDIPVAQVHLDVREDIQGGQEPFARIMAAVKALADDQALVLRAPFEPIPLYDVLGQRGFAHWTECRAADDWSVCFYRRAAARVETTAAPATPTPRRAVLDVRGLEPPQPMLRVLEEIDRLGPGAELEVHHDRRPMFLYPQLDERGFVHETDEPERGLVRILIRRGAA